MTIHTQASPMDELKMVRDIITGLMKIRTVIYAESPIDKTTIGDLYETEFDDAEHAVTILDKLIALPTPAVGAPVASGLFAKASDWPGEDAYYHKPAPAVDHAAEHVRLLTDQLNHDQAEISEAHKVLDTLRAPTNGPEGLGKNQALSLAQRIAALPPPAPDDLVQELILAHRMSHTSGCDGAFWNDEFERLAELAPAVDEPWINDLRKGDAAVIRLGLIRLKHDLGMETGWTQKAEKRGDIVEVTVHYEYPEGPMYKPPIKHRFALKCIDTDLRALPTPAVDNLCQCLENIHLANAGNLSGNRSEEIHSNVVQMQAILDKLIMEGVRLEQESSPAEVAHNDDNVAPSTSPAVDDAGLVERLHHAAFYITADLPSTCDPNRQIVYLDDALAALPTATPGPDVVSTLKALKQSSEGSQRAEAVIATNAYNQAIDDAISVVTTNAAHRDVQMLLDILHKHEHGTPRTQEECEKYVHCTAYEHSEGVSLSVSGMLSPQKLVDALCENGYKPPPQANAAKDSVTIKETLPNEYVNVAPWKTPPTLLSTYKQGYQAGRAASGEGDV